MERNRIVLLEETYKDHQIQLPDHRADQNLKHIIEGIVQMDLEQAWGINHLPKKTVPVLDHPQGEEIFPSIQPEPPLALL